jgi:hypothetical protein
MKNLKYQVLIEQISNPSNKMVRGTNDPSSTRVNRIVQNLKARKGQIGNWADFESFAQFDNIPLNDIRISIIKNVYSVVAA